MSSPVVIRESEDLSPSPRPALPLERALRVALAVALLVGLIAVVVATFALPFYVRMGRAALWGLVLLASMAGWGQLAERIALGRAGADAAAGLDLGLRLAWGAGAMIFAGGLLMMVSLATKPVLLVMVLGGTALASVHTFRWSARPGPSPVEAWRRWPGGVIVVLLALALPMAFQYLGGTAGAYLNQNDDHAAYLVFPRQILATGTLLEPFSFRRMGAYGGQSLLHAFALLGVPNPLQLPVVDVGVALCGVLALILGTADEKTPRGLLALPVLCLVMMPNVRVNTASQMTGVLFFLALFRTAAAPQLLERPTARAVLLGLLTGAACTLRQSYLPAALMFIGLLYLPDAAAGAVALIRRQPARPRWTLVGAAAGATALALLPWALLSFRATRTFLFPLMNGNYHAEHGGIKMASDLEGWVKFFWTNILHCSPVHSMPIFLLAGALIPGRKTARALPALLWASLVGFLMVVYAVSFADKGTLSRYYYGFNVASTLAVLLAALPLPFRETSVAGRARAAVPAVLALVATVSQVQESRGSTFNEYVHIGKAISAARGRPSSVADRDGVYRQMQGAIPPGAPLLVMLDEPFWLDFRRNPISLVDLPGAVSPPPGMPLDDDQALVDYLVARGFHYLAFVRPSASASLYKRDTWARLANESQEPIWKLEAPFYLHMFDRVESLEKSRAHLFDDGRMVALDLDRPRPKEPAKDPAKVPAKDLAKVPAKDSAKEPAKDPAKTAAPKP